MSEIEKAFEMVNSFSAKAAEVAPVIWQKMILLVQAESIAYLAVGGFCLLLFVIFAALWARAPIKGPSCYNAGEWTLTKIVYGLLATASAIPAAINLFYPWNWVGAFAPEARLIARLLGTLTGTTS